MKTNKYIPIILIGIMLYSIGIVAHAEPTELDLNLVKSNIEDRQIGVDQGIIIALSFTGEKDIIEGKLKKATYELYEDNEKGNLTRVNIAVKSDKSGNNQQYTATIMIKPENDLKPLTSYKLVITDEYDNQKKEINFRTKDNAKNQFNLILIVAVFLAAVYIFIIRK